ncbi:hypothetical protein RB2501_01405 [Robiginitalea biformata HTCC2501]|uniref:Uncharacterized protein n=1 Tax=Robiginitalea biformata (strain ATCC BAA-864 / DSM 15991 / KCTC 12146 / HTCC2501) TaxID=313596 RepID=A4CPV6_ROBBH|nr:hypothetical protein RB2501_01405 [Robiginitalea biformata HTCC2501]
MENRVEYYPEAVQVGEGYLLPSLHRANTWVFITKTGIESECVIETKDDGNKQIKWKDFNLEYQMRQRIRQVIARDANHLISEWPEGGSKKTPVEEKAGSQKT